MLKKMLLATVFISSSFVSAHALAEHLCVSCQVSWIDTELANGDLRFATVSGIGSGPCVGTHMTTLSGVSMQQRNQIMSVLLAALVSGATITAHGASTNCGSFNLLTIKRP